MILLRHNNVMKTREYIWNKEAFTSLAGLVAKYPEAKESIK
jgi:hypothetical protein